MNKDYVNQIIGNRKIVKNSCTDNYWIENGLKVPKDKSGYYLCECLNCGKIIPSNIKVLKRNPPKKCAYCSGIGYKGVIKLNRNFYEGYDSYTVMNIVYKDTYIPCYIDSSDVSKVKQYSWRISKKKNKYYVVTGSKAKGLMYLHNYILNFKYDPVVAKEVDHLDGNSLNNKKSNLSIVSRLENIQNTSCRIDNKIGIRGIVKTNNKYKVDFSYNKKRFYFKDWGTLNEAVYCRKYVEEYFGLNILNNNPQSKKYLTLPADVSADIYNYVISIINS